jgi:hypothetical protein
LAPLDEFFGISLGVFVLIALAIFASGHALTACAIGRFARALCNFVFDVFVGLADTAWSFAGFLGGGQRDILGVAGEVAISGVIFGSFFRGVHGLTIPFKGETENKKRGKQEDFFHNN